VSDIRRQGKRISLSVSFSGGGAAINLDGRVTDLSQVGLFLATKHFIPLGDQVHLEFDLPTGHVEAMGEVRWIARGANVAQQGLGIRFLRLSAEAARAIDLTIDAA
jgi:uncharacterized protein (TIGR02266 family)